MSNVLRMAHRDPTGSLLAAADAMGVVARENAGRTDAARRVPQDVIERFREAGLYRVLQPRAFGGYEADFEVFADVVSRAARGDGSTGWVFSVCAVHQ